MSPEEAQEIAKRLEDQLPSLLRKMTGILKSEGIEGIKVAGFEVSSEAQLGIAAASTGTCVVLPDGTIRCT